VGNGEDGWAPSELAGHSYGKDIQQYSLVPTGVTGGLWIWAPGSLSRLTGKIIPGGGESRHPLPRCTKQAVVGVWLLKGSAKGRRNFLLIATRHPKSCAGNNEKRNLVRDARRKSPGTTSSDLIRPTREESYPVPGHSIEDTKNQVGFHFFNPFLLPARIVVKGAISPSSFQHSVDVVKSSRFSH